MTLILAALLAVQEKPNVIIIYADDLGWGDLSCQGSASIRTPNLDRMAAEGQRWTNFYSAHQVCTPSRAALLTGRLPVRNGMASEKRRVLFGNSKSGLPPDEITLAEALKARGYATMAVGKWHLGHLKPHLPTSQGFDAYFGIPYSNDMDRVPGAPPYKEANRDPKIEYFNVPLMRNEEIIERPCDQRTITKRYTEESVKFIKANAKGPFFLYLPHTMPHIPLFRSKDFEGRSARGLYGDVVEELDWSVGEILRTLREEGIDRNTLVFFSSDNGPWIVFDDHGGSAGPLRDGKGGTFEGGMRVPGIFRWPGRIAPGVVDPIGCTMDVFTTAIRLAGGEVPKDRDIDGLDLAPALFGKGPSPRETMAFYRDAKLYAVRKGPWKAHFFTKAAYGDPKETAHDPPLLYHLGIDPGEKWDVAAKNPDVVADLRKLFDATLAAVKPGENQLEK
jgi:arylsulfatase A-like enzyme